MPADVRPYLVPTADAWSHGPWHLWDGQMWEPLPEALPAWDPHTDLLLQAVVAVDVERVRAEARFDAAASLRLAASWTSSSSGVTERATLLDVSGSDPTVLSLRLPSRRLGGTLELRTTLTLGRSDVAAPGVASLPGSVLLDHRASARLEGSGAQFPLAVVDFSKSRIHSEASWHLQTSHELEAPFLGAFVLLINSRDRELTEAISSGASDGRRRALVEQLEQELAALMLGLAVRAADEIAEREWPDQSIGAVLKALLSQEHMSFDFRAYDDAAELTSHLAGSVRARGHGRMFE